MVASNFTVIAFLLLGVATAKVLATDCYDRTTCGSCKGATEWIGWIPFSCYWCPLNNRCHVYGSQYNPCFGDLNVDSSDTCPVPVGGTYDPNKAYEYLTLSSAAYIGDPEQCLDAAFPSPGYEVKHAVVVKCDDYLFDYKECVAYTAVSTSSQVIAIAVRGTKSTLQLFDQFSVALLSSTVPFRSDCGNVEPYFKNIHDEMLPCIKDSLQELILQYPSYKVVVTGHSLGGAVASLFALTLVADGIVSSSNLELYTFGQPRVGDKKFAACHDSYVKQNSWLVVHNRDIVPHIPFCNILGCNIPYNMAFHHGKEVYYPQTDDMNLASSYIICHENEDSSCSNGAVDANWCDTDMDDCIRYHKEYFGVNVGGHCQDTLAGQTITPLWTSSSVPQHQCLKVSG